ncbi:MAG: hypothetical protein MUP17_11965 [candidate division Zixibacteria bacterium]|nr:hypothetical protein [candidate division Zixibacteria bacterium]
MTIGIAVCLTDGALLIADGKLSTFSPNVTTIRDDDDKIHRLAETIGAISFGIDPLTKAVLYSLEKSKIINPDQLLPEQILQVIEKNMEPQWNCFLAHVSPASERNRPEMRAGFLIGGIAKNISFIGGILFRPDGHDSPKIETQPFNWMLLGGVEHGSKVIFKKYIEFFSQNLQGKVNTEELLPLTFILAGIETIRDVEKKDPTIGGRIKYVRIHSGLPYCVSFA